YTFHGGRMRLEGRVVKWDVVRAFGFIKPTTGGSELFAHKTAFTNSLKTPKMGELVTFTTVKDKRGRVCAGDVSYKGEKPQKQRTMTTKRFSVYLAILFLAAVCTLYYMSYVPKILMYAYLGLSVFTFFVYAWDKSKAQRNSWRTTENTLHMLALAGGWPGAALAQQWLRHKSSKKDFRLVFWITVLLNIGTLAFLISPSGSQYLTILSEIVN
ncbi:MAG: uncharacterized membrane protein YsdA (DUF1294 family)/cold shock CspA family protein, partial [Granulosicoccus sp.]